MTESNKLIIVQIRRGGNLVTEEERVKRRAESIRTQEIYQDIIKERKDEKRRVH